MSAAIVIRHATSQDFDVLRLWLSNAGLPTADLTVAHMPEFLVALSADVPVGIIGLEKFGDVGLLRSLVVDNEFRGTGIGRQLVSALESQAIDAGITEFWLLTIDADPFFSRLGYVASKRDDAPEVICNTDEFSGLCPDDAVLMRKQL